MSGEFHHYVPQSLLRAFSYKERKKYKIWFISKLANKSAICRNLRRAAGENGFYDYKEKTISLEKKYFDRIDNESASAIKRLLNLNNITELESQYFEMAARFVAAQICRVPAMLGQFNAIERAIKDVSSNFSGFNENVNDYFLNFIVKNEKAYTALLMKKKITLIKSDTDQFVVGDNPVVTLETRNPILNVDEITCVIDAEVFMIPISPKDILVFFDSDDKETLKRHALSNNDWQFIRATEYVFYFDSKHLENELKIYHQNCYKNMMDRKPSLLDEHGLAEGDPMSIGSAEFSFEGQAKEQLIEIIKKERKYERK